MINLDEVMRRHDMRTVSGGEIKCLIAEVHRLRAILKLSVSLLERTLDSAEDIAAGRVEELVRKVEAFIKQEKLR